MLVRIAVHLDRDEGCNHRLQAATQLAVVHKAELIGVYATHFPLAFYDEVGTPSEVYSLLRAKSSTEEAEVRTLFYDVVGATGVKARWKAPEGEAEQILALYSRYCDLMVMGQVNRDQSSPRLISLAEAVMMSAGRPVLMIPYSGRTNSIGKRILLCWDYRREAARAFADAHPLLEECEELTILTVDGPSEHSHSSAIDPQELASYCKLRGYRLTRVTSRQSNGVGVGNAILNAAADHSCDLIVMGAYGHSRLKEWVMGGASRTLLETMTVPVLFSH